MNFAVQWIRHTKHTDVFLEKQTGILREYLRTLRNGNAPPTRNSGKRKPRKTADQDERWAKLAQIAFPESEAEQRRFIESVVAMQTGKQEQIKEPAIMQTTVLDTSGVIVRLCPDFAGTIEITWENKVYRLTRVS